MKGSREEADDFKFVAALLADVRELRIFRVFFN
jgi:hypothetical protein